MWRSTSTCFFVCLGLANYGKKLLCIYRCCHFLRKTMTHGCQALRLTTPMARLHVCIELAHASRGCCYILWKEKGYVWCMYSYGKILSPLTYMCLLRCCLLLLPATHVQVPVRSSFGKNYMCFFCINALSRCCQIQRKQSRMSFLVWRNIPSLIISFLMAAMQFQEHIMTAHVDVWCFSATMFGKNQCLHFVLLFTSLLALDFKISTQSRHKTSGHSLMYFYWNVSIPLARTTKNAETSKLIKKYQRITKQKV